jgi:hypothetical protein
MRRLLSYCFHGSCLCWKQRQAQPAHAFHFYVRAQEGQGLLIQAARAGEAGRWGGSIQGIPQQLLPGTLLPLLLLLLLLLFVMFVCLLYFLLLLHVIAQNSKDWKCSAWAQHVLD